MPCWLYFLLIPLLSFHPDYGSDVCWPLRGQKQRQPESCCLSSQRSLQPSTIVLHTWPLLNALDSCKLRCTPRSRSWRGFRGLVRGLAKFVVELARCSAKENITSHDRSIVLCSLISLESIAWELDQVTFQLPVVIRHFFAIDRFVVQHTAIQRVMENEKKIPVRVSGSSCA